MFVQVSLGVLSCERGLICAYAAVQFESVTADPCESQILAERSGALTCLYSCEERPHLLS